MTVEKELKRIAKLDRYVRPEKITGAIKLDSNENFALDGEFVLQVVTEAAKRVDLREYPIDELDGLYEQLARYTGINEKYIGAGSGSDQIIELLLTTLVAGNKKKNKGSRSRATVFVPTFSYFVNRCELHGMRVDRVPLDKNFELDIDRFARSARRSDLVYLCSPNNPTGGQVPRKDAVELLDRLDDSSLVLVDEAYADFSSYSLAREATRRDNVIVLRTLSKAFGLAGARVGYMIAGEKTAGVFRSTIQSPYPVSTLSLTIATGVLERADFVKKTIEGVKGERKRVFERLAEIKGIRVFRSDANFLFVETGKSYSAIARALEKEGIVVKLLGNVSGHAGCMRVTIGTQEMNDRFLKCVEEGATS
ncbi:histidinol-phosphate transaminase [Nitrososphaera viennensis]|uniref:Histidinol-phosphate aminotransferase n=2 Tax=Nitrososphaera viennensis TaxID=1034015 RepID=A0A060HT08_9ARCH|nr:histidinol-phosphate transaminase [Nitrososphaera viennensis]AIC16616.1 histidinol-phosphate aminotransferase [Nitrososphaera viennensis EN76]UVS68543.1 histidinol-phosphate transaminase [Nitrososphaera viennensis]